MHEAAFLRRSEVGKKPHEKKDTDGKSLHNKKLHAKKDPVDGKSLQAKKMNRGLHKEKDSKDGKSLHAKKAGKKGGRGNCDGTETYHWCRSCQKVFTLQQQAGSTGTNTRCNLQVPGKTSCQGRCHVRCAGTVGGYTPLRRCPGCVPASMRHLIPRESSESAGDEDESEGEEDEEED